MRMTANAALAPRNHCARVCRVGHAPPIHLFDEPAATFTSISKAAVSYALNVCINNALTRLGRYSARQQINTQYTGPKARRVYWLATTEMQSSLDARLQNIVTSSSRASS